MGGARPSGRALGERSMRVGAFGSSGGRGTLVATMACRLSRSRSRESGTRWRPYARASSFHCVCSTIEPIPPAAMAAWRTALPLVPIPSSAVARGRSCRWCELGSGRGCMRPWPTARRQAACSGLDRRLRHRRQRLDGFGLRRAVAIRGRRRSTRSMLMLESRLRWTRGPRRRSGRPTGTGAPARSSATMRRALPAGTASAALRARGRHRAPFEATSPFRGGGVARAIQHVLAERTLGCRAERATMPGDAASEAREWRRARRAAGEAAV